MTFYQSLATVLLRVWAAVLLISGVSYVVSVIGMLLVPNMMFGSGPDAGRMRIFELVQFVAYYGAGLSLWFFARPLGRRIGAGFSSPPPGIEIDSERLIQIGAFLIGLFYIVEYGPRSLADLAAIFVDIVKQADAEQVSGARVVHFPGWRQLASDWTITAIALVIAFRVRGIAKLFVWLRSVGQYREKDAGGAEKSVARE